jgi:hypothetical protein
VLKSYGQANLDKIEWVEGEVNTGEMIVAGGIAMDATTREGTLLLKTEQGIKAYPPDKVVSFFFMDQRKGAADTVFFETVQTKYTDRPTNQRSFQRLVRKGPYYSLYKSYVPNRKAMGFILPPISGWIVVGFFTYVESEEMLFLEKRGAAFQISRPRNMLEEEGYNAAAKIDQSAFYDVVEPHAQQVKSFIKSNRLKFKKAEDMEKIVDYLNTL